MELIIAITVISTIVVIFNMLGRIRRLEQALKGVQLPTTTATPAQGSASDVFVRGESDSTGARLESGTLPQSGQAKEPDALERLIAWAKEDWLMKLGAFLMLLAIGWFAQYAISNNWIDEATRIWLGIALGLSFMLGGYLHSVKSKVQGGVLVALGSAMVLVVTFIARFAYDMFDPAVALVGMFAVMLTTMFVAVKFSNKSLAVVAVALAALAPLFAVYGELPFYVTFAYLMVLTAGSIWVVSMTSWRELVFESLLIVFIYSVPFWLGTYDGGLGLNELIFIYAFAGLFFVSSLVGLLRGGALATQASDMLTAFGTGGLIFAWTLVAAPTEMQTFMLLLWALVFAVGSYTAYAGTKQLAPLTLYGGVALALVGFATSIELDDAMLVAALSAEIAVASVVAVLLTGQRAAATRVAALFILPGLMSIQYLVSPEWGGGVWFDGALALYAFVLAMVAAAVAIMVVAPLPEDSEPDAVTMPLVLLVVSVGYFFMFVWLILHALNTETLATGMALLVYTIIGMSAYFSKSGKYAHTLHVFGQLVLAGVVARLLLVEVWSLDISGRIVVFALVGVALISTAFATRNRK